MTWTDLPPEHQLPVPTRYDDDAGGTLFRAIFMLLVGFPICLMLLAAVLLGIADLTGWAGPAYFAQGIGWLLGPWLWVYGALFR